MRIFTALLAICLTMFNCKKDIQVTNTKATLTTTSISSLTATSAISGGNISSDGGTAVTARGVCWSQNPKPDISGSHTVDGAGKGNFSSNITGLNPNIFYYVRAYATNSLGTEYGNEISFVLQGQLPTVSTAAATGITNNSSLCGGIVTDAGSSPILAQGVCWGLTANPNLSGSHTTDTSNVNGTFTSTLSSLNPGTTYYVKAYATNASGTAYGSQVTFKTQGPPQITTTSVEGVTLRTAVLTSNISDDGGYTITERGLCYSTSTNPTIADNKVVSGVSTGIFSDTIKNLLPNTGYHARAFVTNASGTFYGDNLTFRTYSNFRLLRTVKEGDPLNYEEFTYNTQGMLVKYFRNLGGGASHNMVDTFIYNNNNVLIKSAYNLGNTINLAAPYAQTLYTVSGQYPVSSEYYYGSTLITRNTYTFNSSGKLSFVNVTVINGTYAGIPHHNNTFIYDASGNLSTVYYKEPFKPEYTITQYSNIDTKPNPFYGLPWYFDFEIYLYNDFQMSTNNASTIKRTGYGGVINSYEYVFEYNADGLVSRKANAGGGVAPPRLFLYEYF